MMMPLARCRPTSSIRSCLNRSNWLSSRAVWMDAIRKLPCRRMETSGGCRGAGSLGFGIAGPDHFEAEQPFGLLDATLQVAHRGEFAQIDADCHQRLGDIRRQ